MITDPPFPLFSELELVRVGRVVALCGVSRDTPVTCCDDLSRWADSGMDVGLVGNFCGEHPELGLLCPHCLSGHDDRVGSAHRVFTADLHDCIVCGEWVPLPQDEGWADITVRDVVLQSQVAERLHRFDSLHVAISVRDRLCERCR